MDYDKVHELVKSIKDTGEYKSFASAKEAAMENDLNVSLINEFKRLQLASQAQQLSGKPVDEITQQKLRKIAETLQFNAQAAAFLMAEYNFNRIISDVYRIIAQGVGIDIDSLGE